MKVSLTKILALGGLCALFAGASCLAVAQDAMAHGHSRHVVHKAKHKIKRLKAAYARNVARGNRAAAEQAHLRAKAIRHRVRAIHH